VVVLNAPDREEFELRAFDGPLRAVYQGGLGPGRDFADLVALSGARGVELTARILYADPAALRAVAGGELRIAEPVPQEHAVAALRDFEVGVVFDRPQSRNSELSLPNKLFEYLMGGLAVVAPALPGLRGVVEDEGVGVTVEPGDTAALGAALEELAADRPRVTAMRRRAREVALARFNAETQSGALLRAWGLA